MIHLNPIFSWWIVILWLLGGSLLLLWWWLRLGGIARIGRRSTGRKGMRSFLPRRSQSVRQSSADSSGRVNHASVRRAPYRRTAIRRILMVLVVGLMLAGPSVPVEGKTAISTVDVFFVVDRTGSMSATDGPDGDMRLQQVRQDMHAILDYYPDARFSVISLDSQGRRDIPLTQDRYSVETWVDALVPEVTERSQGSSLDRVLPVLTEWLEQAQVDDPQDVRVFYILSDGEPTDDGTGSQQASESGTSWSGLEQYITAGAVLGYGTIEGATMHEFRSTDTLDSMSKNPLIMDPETGKPAVSRANFTILSSIAEDLDVPLVERSAGGDEAQFTSGLDVHGEISDAKKNVRIDHIVVWPLAYVMIGLGLWELAWSVKQSGVLRRFAQYGRRK
ncbi:vWA domain-containing protein [Actinomyces vulturis]|uniref:vWA domain-containing protein n=1 Tax=Actinomyces vulturis TaxID=1857645 RepID=UPI00083663E6|nr:VWA domain-containing protein [Actinomyces vulturis]